MRLHVAGTNDPLARVFARLTETIDQLIASGVIACAVALWLAKSGPWGTELDASTQPPLARCTPVNARVIDAVDRELAQVIALLSAAARRL
jgi:hypothetical protein